MITTAVGARLSGALGWPLWGDEIASARVLLKPTLQGVYEQVKLRESTPPAWYAFVWAWHRIGVPIVDLRLWSVAFSGALAALILVYARQLMPLWAAALAALGVALGQQFVLAGEELRCYAALALLALLFAFAIEAAASKPSLRNLLAVVACTSLGVLTHYFFLLTVATSAIWLCTSSAARGARVRVSAALSVGLIPCLLWLPAFIDQIREKHTRWIDGFNALKVAYIDSAFFVRVGLLYHRIAPPPSDPAGITLRLAFLALVVLVSILLARKSARGSLCALLANGPVALAAVASFAGAHIFDVRNLLEVAPFIAVVIAYAISHTGRLAPLAGAAALGLTAVSFLQGRAWTPLPFDKAAALLAAEGWQGDDPIVLFGATSPFPRPNEYFPPALGWYLPGHPRLVVTRPSLVGCHDVYIVAATAPGRRTTDSLRHVLALRRTGSIIVARVRPNQSLAADVHSRRAHILRASPTFSTERVQRTCRHDVGALSGPRAAK